MSKRTVTSVTLQEDSQSHFGLLFYHCMPLLDVTRPVLQRQRQSQGSEGSTTETGICADVAELSDTWEVKDGVIDKLE